MTWKELDTQLKDYQNRILGHWYSKEKDGEMIFRSTEASYRNAPAELITIVDGETRESRYYLFIGHNQDKICMNVGDHVDNPFIPDFLIENMTSQYLLVRHISSGELFSYERRTDESFVADLLNNIQQEDSI